MNYAVEMGSGAMIYTPSFMIGSAIQKLMGGIHIQTHRWQGDLVSLLLCFQNKESRLKITMISDLRLFVFAIYWHILQHSLTWIIRSILYTILVKM
jgi:hypothetical protein